MSRPQRAISDKFVTIAWFAKAKMQALRSAEDQEAETLRRLNHGVKRIAAKTCRAIGLAEAEGSKNAKKEEESLTQRRKGENGGQINSQKAST
jgi:hypothetical protein